MPAEPASPPDLSSQLGRYGSSAHLVTVTDDGRPHVTAVPVTPVDGGLSVPAGGHSRANVAAHPSVTLLWAPPDGGSHSLVLDGTASVVGEGLVIRPDAALLHRVAHVSPDVPRCFAVDVTAGPSTVRE